MESEEKPLKIEELADSGDVEAQVNLAFLHEVGLDRPVNWNKAMHYWQLAAKQGHQVAQKKVVLLQQTIDESEDESTDAAERQKETSMEDEHKKPEAGENPGIDEETPLLTDEEDISDETPLDDDDQTEETPLDMDENTGPQYQKITDEVNHIHAHRDGHEIPPKILIVDDESELLDLYRIVLEEHHYTVITSDRGEDALKKLIANPDVKVVITDLKMPGMNGIQFLKMIRKMKLADFSKVIVMTAYSRPDLIVAGKKLGVNAWLAKPFDAEKMIDTIRSLLKASQLSA